MAPSTPNRKPRRIAREQKKRRERREARDEEAEKEKEVSAEKLQRVSVRARDNLFAPFVDQRDKVSYLYKKLHA